MPIITNIDVMLARRKMSSGELAQKVGIPPANLSILKCGKAKAVRLSTLEASAKRWTASRETCWSSSRKSSEKAWRKSGFFRIFVTLTLKRCTHT